MLQKILTYGALAGVIVGVPLFGLTVALNDHPPLPYGMVIGFGRHHQVLAGLRLWSWYQCRRRRLLCARLGGSAGMEHFKAEYANPFYRLPMTFAEIFPVGVLVSLVSAGLLCNRRFLPARSI